jgi:hypothetical protein
LGVPSWFAPAVSSVLVLSGFQLMTAWLLVKVLAELSKREAQAYDDLGTQREGVVPAPTSTVQVGASMEELVV